MHQSFMVGRPSRATATASAVLGAVGAVGMVAVALRDGQPPTLVVGIGAAGVTVGLAVVMLVVALSTGRAIIRRVRTRTSEFIAALDAAGTGVVIVAADGTVLHANATARALLGVVPRAPFPAGWVDEGRQVISPGDHPVHRARAGRACPATVVGVPDGGCGVEWRAVTASPIGRRLSTRMVVVTVTDATVPVTAVVDAQAEQAVWHHQVHHDPLTGLANHQQLRAVLASWATTRPTAVVEVDLDDFATINDTLGRDVGDEVLVQVGLRLRAATTDGVVARDGGDAFIIAVPADADTDVWDLAESVAARCVGAVGGTYQTSAGPAVVAASAGWAAAMPGTDPTVAVAEAGEARRAHARPSPLARPAAPPPTGPAAWPAAGPRVAVVDDDPGMRLLADRVLSADGFVPLCLDPSEDVVGTLAAAPPAVLLCDLMMPGRSGADLVTTIRRSLPHLPVVLWSATSTAHLQDVAASVGAVAVHKGEVEQIAPTVRDLLDGTRAQPVPVLRAGPSPAVR